MATSTTPANSLVVSALSVRTNLGKLLDRIGSQSGSLVIERRGTPHAVLLSIRDYVKLAAPEPEILRILGGESERKGTDKITSRQVDRVVRVTRAQKKKR
jgi:PHD/YefM family antitoxin component YafN of YafNO toxin-antitoxin module